MKMRHFLLTIHIVEWYGILKGDIRPPSRLEAEKWEYGRK